MLNHKTYPGQFQSGMTAVIVSPITETRRRRILTSNKAWMNGTWSRYGYVGQIETGDSRSVGILEGAA